MILAVVTSNPFIFEMISFLLDSVYRSACGPSYLKPYSPTICKVTVTHNESASGLVETY